MNKAYKIIWSHARKCYVVVSELAKSRGKNNTRSIAMRVAKTLVGGALMAMVAMPGMATAQNIEKVDGQKFNETVNNIHPDRVINDTGVNAFKDFKLDDGHVANMHLDTASNLVNFVNNQANISGTVNAVKNNTIGGNLYFLSPNGVVVSGSGVINAGSVHLMAPSQSEYNAMVNSNGVIDSAFTQRWSKIQDGSIALNADATITVQGHINTVDGASVHAGKVNIEGSAAIVSQNSLDYASLVNTDGASGLSGNLTVNKTGDGKIVIAAKGTNEANTDVAEVKLDPVVNIKQGAAVSAVGDVSVTADASNASSYTVADINAVVNVDGSVTGKNVNIAATANDTAKIVNGDEFTDSLQGVFTGSNVNLLGTATEFLRTVGVDVSVAVHTVKAETNIGQTAVLTATGADPEKGKALSVTADSSLTAVMATSPDGLTDELLNIASTRYLEVPVKPAATSVAVAKLDNKAVVNVSGQLKTNTGGANVAASANATPGINATQSLSSNENAALTMGLGVLVGKNESEVNLRDSAKLQNIKGEFAAAANAAESLSLTAGAKSYGSNAMAGTAVAVADFDSSANLNVDTTVKAGSVNLASQNTIAENSISASNSIGGSTVSAENLKQSVLENSGLFVSNLKTSLVDGIFGKFGAKSPEAAKPLFEDAASLFNAGASVAIASEKNTAKTYLSKNAHIEATAGNVDITSDIIAKSTHMSAAGSMGNAAQKQVDKDNKESVQAAKIQASVLVTDIENSAKVEAEQGSAAQHVVIKGNDITVKSDSQFTHALDNLIDNFNTIKPSIEELKDTGLTKDWEALGKAIENYQNDVGTFTEIPAAAMQVLTDLQKYPAPFKSIGSKITDFLKVENYANFSVSSTTEGGSDKNPTYNPTRDLTKDNAKLAIAGAVDVAFTKDSANVNLGNYTDLQGTGNTAVTANLDRTDASLNGNLGLQKGDQNAVGGVVSVFNADREALVSLGEEVKAKGNTLALKADSTTNHVDLATGASIGGDTGVKGMATYVMGANRAKVDVGNNTSLTSGGAMDITGHNTAGITNIAGAIGFGGATGIGASVAINEVDVDSIVNVGKATINTGSLTAKTDLDGNINSIAVAGGLAVASDSEEASSLKNFSAGLQNKIHKVENFSRTINDKINNIIPETIRKAGGIKKNTKLSTDNVAKNDKAGKQLSQLSIGGAGSVALNLMDRHTKTILDGATITFTGNDRKLSLSAKDFGFTGAWAGAAGLTFNTRVQGGKNENSTNVGIAGAVGWSGIDNETIAALKNSTIKKVAAITNEAERSGAVVSAGLGMALAASGAAKGGSSYTGAASVSVADMTNTVKAELLNNTVTESGSVTNTVTDSDTLVTGGVNASIAAGQSKSAAIGGSVVYNKITNTLDASITGGDYTLTGDVNNKVATGITEVGGSIGLALATTSGEGSAYGVEGVAAYNGLTNTANAIIDGATISARNVTVDARDTKDTSKKYDSYINERGLDANGKSYAEAISDALDDEGKANISSTGGNIIVGAGLSAAVSLGQSGSASAAAALSISEVDNDFTAAIKNNSNITGTGLLNVKADSHTLMIGAAAGGSGSSDGFGGSASFSWQTDGNNVTAEVSDSTIKGMSGNIVSATTSAKDINVAGQVAVGSKAAGLAGAYNRLENTTAAKVTNSNLEDDAKKTLSINAANTGRVYAVVAGVSASTDNFALNGAVAVNSGADNITAELTGGTVKNATSISVASTDDTKKLAVAGGFTLSMGTAVGGAVAYNAIGDTARQVNSATINNATIDNNTSQINVTAKDTSGLTTVGFGLGLASGSPAVNGAAAVGLKSGDVTAGINNTAIQNSTGNLTVKASTDDDFSTNAVVAAVGENAAIGVGVGVTRDETHTQANFSGGSFAGNNFALDAAGHADITTVGVGGGVNAGSGLGLAGSVTINIIDSETKSLLDSGAQVTAKAPVITAFGDEKIANYVGALSISAQGAAIGASVSVNEINSKIDAAIDGADTKVNVKSDDAHSVNDTVSDDDILDESVDKEIFKSAKSLKDARSAKSYKGLLVDASGTHTLKSFLVNAGATGTGVALNGTVDVNLIGGHTKAKIADAKINNDQNYKSSVNVIAHDYTNSAGVVGTVNLSLEGVAAGLGSDTNKVTRATEASLIGPQDKYDLYANDVNIEAKSRQGISSLTAGGSFAGEGAAVNAAGGVSLLDGDTNAFLKNVDLKKVHNVALTADHLSRTHLTGTVFAAAGIGAGVGVAVGYIDDEGTTEATAENISVTYDANKKYNFDVKANNDLKINYLEVGIGGAGIGAGVAGSIGIADINGTAKAQLLNSNIGADTLRAKNVNITAANNLYVSEKAGVGALGAAGVGVGVSVNKADSTTAVNISGSKVYANAMNAGAKDTKNLWQTVGNVGIGGAAVGLNVMVTNIGKDVAANFDAGDGNTMSLQDVFDDVNNAMQAGNLTEKESHGVEGSNGKVLTNTRSNITRAAQIKNSASGINVTDSAIYANGDVNLSADTITNANMKSVAASAGGSAAVNGTVALLDVKGNALGNVANSTINSGGDINISASQNGLSELEIRQGALSGVVALSGAYGSVTKSGNSELTFAGNTMNAKNIGIIADDQSRAKVDTIGASGAMVGSLNVLIGDVTTKGNSLVKLSGGNNLSGSDSLLLAAIREPEEDEQNTAEISTFAASAALGFSGTGISATSHDSSNTSVIVQNGKDENNNTLTNKLSTYKLGVLSMNTPKVKTSTESIAASLLASGAVTEANASAGATTNIDIADGTTLDAGNTQMVAHTDTNLTTEMEGLGISGLVAAQVNTGRADAYGSANVNLGKINVKNVGMLTVMSEATSTKNIRAAGISAAGLVASGTNVAKSDSTLNATLNAAGTDGSPLAMVTLLAMTEENTTSRAEGDGGAIADISPYAAKLENSLKTTTATNVKGDWNTMLFVAGADLKDTHNLTTDATRAAVVGGSGVGITNAAQHNTSVNLNNANITTIFTLGLAADNTINYNDSQKAGSYGGITGSDSEVVNYLNANTNVNIANSNLKGNGLADIRTQARSKSNIASKNYVEGAGLVQILAGKTVSNTAFNNKVNVNNSNLSTETEDLSVNATSSVNHDIEAEAVDEGGAAGVTTVNNHNTLVRRDKVDILGSSKLDSGRDLLLMAGSDFNRMKSDLRLLTYANAHNATFIPAETSPKITDNLTLDRGVTLGDKTNATSFRHTYLMADEGTSYIEESARQFKIWGQGETGTRRLTSTALGENEVSQNKTAKVDVKGKVTAGIHNQLDIKISGNIKRKGTDSNATIDTSDLKITSDQDWYDVNSAITSQTIKNPYITRYDELLNAKKDYNPDSIEYFYMNEEMQSLLDAMDKENFLYHDSKGNKAILREIPVTGVELPKISISGGNVFVDAATLAGENNINAKGSPNINITNSGNAYLRLNDVTIEEGGGRLYWNDKLHKDNSGESAINIRATGSEDADKISRPNIYIDGTVDNLSGAVNINNSKYDINITGAVNGKTVSITADQGAINLSNPEGLVNVGGDPIAKYMFDQKTAEKIVKALANDTPSGEGKVQLWQSYSDYRKWLKEKVGLTDAEMSYDVDPNKTGYIAGGNISITAKDVNINGLIQSGYTNYTNYIDADSVSYMQRFLRAIGADGAEFDEDVIGSSLYSIGKSGMIWNYDTKRFDYAVPLYYNPTTGHIVADDIDVRGGRVDIKGAIYSTGNGRIVVADGPANISIDASGANADLYMGRITNNDREGFIRIHDTRRNLIEESKNNMHREYKPGESASAKWQDGALSKYTPSKSLLQWTGGTTGQEVKDRSYRKYYASFFGLFNLWTIGSTEALIENIGSDWSNVRTTTRAIAADGTMARGAMFHNKLSDLKQFPVFRLISILPTWLDIVGDDDLFYIGNRYNTGAVTLGKINASEMEYTNLLHTTGYVTYSWTETRGSSVGANFFINGNRPIGLDFAKNDGNINIESGGNLYFRDNVASVSGLRSDNDDSSLAFSANGDIKTLKNARLLTGYLTARGKNIDLAHSAIGNEATVNLLANGGNINFVSDKGDLRLRDVGIKNAPDNGKLNITAEGNIKLYPYLKQAIYDSKGNFIGLGDYASLVYAPAINLTSLNGGIGTGDIPLYVKAGTDVTSSKLQNSSLTATALKDINILQTDGDMRLARIESKAGDVKLEAKNGSIVDASGGAFTEDSSAEDRIARWKELGMISDADSDNSRTEAAKASKAKKLAIVEGRFKQLALTEAETTLYKVDEKKLAAYKTAADAYAKDAGIIAARKEYISLMQAATTETMKATAREKLATAREKLAAAQAVFFAGRGFSADEQKAIADYGELSVSDNYGWSKNELLYAVQDGIVNSQPGMIDIVNSPNVIGRDITLIAQNGGIGNDAASVYIENADLTKLANMKLMASAKPGDLTWDANGVNIRRQIPVTIQVKDGGEVQFTGKNNVYVSATADSALNIRGGIYTDGDIRLSAGQGISIDDGTRLQGKNLTLLAGAGNIGSKEKFLEMMINGWLMANSGQSIYVHQNGEMPLTLLSAAAGMDAWFRADNGIRMVNDYGLNMGYIRAGRLVDLYTKKGDIDNVRVLATDATVNAIAPHGQIKLLNVGGELKLGTVADEAAYADINPEIAVKMSEAEKRLAEAEKQIKKRWNT